MARRSVLERHPVSRLEGDAGPGLDVAGPRNVRSAGGAPPEDVAPGGGLETGRWSDQRARCTEQAALNEALKRGIERQQTEGGQSQRGGGCARTRQGREPALGPGDRRTPGEYARRSCPPGGHHVRIWYRKHRGADRPPRTTG